MIDITSFDHIALAVPDLNEQIERLRTMGMVVQMHAEPYALVADRSPASRSS